MDVNRAVFLSPCLSSRSFSFISFSSPLHMSHSLAVIFLAQTFAFAVSIEDFFPSNISPLHTIVEALKCKQYWPTEMEYVNCNLI